MEKADYSLATPEERENVVQVLQKNVIYLIEQKKTKNSERQREIVDQLCNRIRKGDVITGKDYKKLLRLFQKKPVGE